MAKIIFVHADGLRQQVFAEAGDSVMRAAVVNDVAGIDADCGGSLSCATCTWMTRGGTVYRRCEQTKMKCST